MVVIPVETKAPSAPPVIAQAQPPPHISDPILVTAIIVPVISCVILICCALVWQRQRKTIKNLTVAAAKAQKDKKERRSGVVESGSLKKAVSLLKGRNSTSRSSGPCSQPSGNINIITVEDTSPSHMTINRPKSPEFAASSPLRAESSSSSETHQTSVQDIFPPELVLPAGEGGSSTSSGGTGRSGSSSYRAGRGSSQVETVGGEPVMAAMVDELPPTQFEARTASNRNSNSPSRKRLGAVTSTSFSMSRRGIFPNPGIFIPNDGLSTSLSGSRSGKSSLRTFRRASEEAQLENAMAQLGIDESSKAFLSGLAVYFRSL